MRTEIKIGVAAAGFVGLVALIYFLLGGLGSAEKSKSSGEPAARQEPAAREKVKPAPAGGEIAAQSPATSKHPEYLIAKSEPPSSEGTGAAQAGQAPPGTGAQVVLKGLSTGSGQRAAGAKVEEPSGSALLLPGAGGAAGTGATVGPAAARERIYTVQEGDLGFWTISKKMYGSGEHWQLIRDANPGVDSSNLKVGLKLRIPPLRQKIEPGAPVAVAAATGEKPYTVQEGDNGFWAIAQRVYGDGSLWQVIARANPDVDSRRLRVGQKLVIPTKPMASSAALTHAGGILKVGYTLKKYVVQEGDAGFWAVSVKAYSTGRYWPVIAEANPGVEPTRLKVGQELVVPELTEEMRKKYGGQPPAARSERPSARPADAVPADTAGPIFVEQ